MDQSFKALVAQCSWSIRAVLGLSLFAMVAAGALTRLSAAAPAEVMLIDVKGPISVGAQHHFGEALEKAQSKDAQLLVIRLDTPGGLVSVTRGIVSQILTSDVPIAIYVAPSGARAASAGTYLAYASHISAMAPGTHLGAATPIPIGAPPSPQAPFPGRGADKNPTQPQKTPAEKKLTNDAVAYLRALAELRGRNAEWAEKAVVEAATLTARDAERENVVDLVANNVADLLQKIDGKEVSTSSGPKLLKTSGLSVRYFDASWQSWLISIITDPNVAFILLMIGIYGILFEFWSPGLAGPGIIGAISLMIALMALSALPISSTGLGLLILGIAFLVAEAFAPGFGILGLGGIVAFVLGALFLFDPGGADFDLSVAWPVIAGAALTTAIIFAGALSMVAKSRTRAIRTGSEELPGMRGEILEWSRDKGRVRVHGEAWAAMGEKSYDLQPGDFVIITGRTGLTLLVAPSN